MFEPSCSSGLFSGGGDGPGNSVKKFVIPKLKNSKINEIERGVVDLKISDGEVSNNFSSLQALMEQHQKSTVSNDKTQPSEQNCYEDNTLTLEQFSKNFLNKKNSTDDPSQVNVEIKPTFVIPKLRKKNPENVENKCLIDLSSALKFESQSKHTFRSKSEVVFESEPLLTPESSEKYLNSSTSTNKECPAFEDIIFDSNLDSYKFFNNIDLELNKKISSPFGKILCRKWKSNYVNVVKNENFLPSSKVVQFDFSTPSPDDIILKYLRRK